MKDLSIIIPSFNGKNALEKTLNALKEVPEAEIIVVDGGSTDGSVEFVEQNFANVKLLTIENHGYSYALNRGIEISKGEFLLLINSDLIIKKETLKILVEELKNQKTGLVAPTLLNENGSKQMVFSPFYLPNWINQPKMRVNVVHGACLVTRRDVIDKAGLFDENFFFYNEELDWCWRVKKAGFDVYRLSCEVIHLGGASTPEKPDFLLEGHRGGLYLTNKHYPGLLSELFRYLIISESWLLSWLDYRPEFRKTWKRLLKIAYERRYLDSPFNLSGPKTD